MSRFENLELRRHFPPRAGRHTHNPNGVAESSPGLPDSRRATLGNRPFPTHPFRAQRGERSEYLGHPHQQLTAQTLTTHSDK
jgi:hypothetical protein